MGADIHMYVERKLSNGSWATVQTFEPVDKTAMGMKSDNAYDWMFYDVTSRDYGLFAALAGVRGDGPKPLGVPDDASPLYLQYVQDWAGDGHSHSWCSATEFVNTYVSTMDSDTPTVKRFASWVLDVGSNNAVLRFLDVYCSVRVSENGDADDYRFCFFFDN